MSRSRRIWTQAERLRKRRTTAYVSGVYFVGFLLWAALYGYVHVEGLGVHQPGVEGALARLMN